MQRLKKYWLPALLIVVAFLFPLVDETLDTELMFPVIIRTASWYSTRSILAPVGS